MKHLKVFVAAPGDLDVEREAVAEAAKEVNQTIGDVLGIRLEVLDWRSHTVPSLGSDPQQIINEQIGDNYDIFIGLLWTRFGTPTPREESGTLEEFKRARVRFEEDPSAISVMFYFKDEPVSPADLDPGQLGKVLEFRKELAKTALVGTFTDLDDLESKLRIHLSGLLKSQSSVQGGDGDVRAVPEVGADDQAVTKVGDMSEDEEGFLDLVVAGSEGFDDVTAISKRIHEHIIALTASMNEATTSLQSLDLSRPGDARKAKSVVNSLSEKMSHIADRVGAETLLLDVAYTKAVKSFEGAALMVPEMSTDQNDALEESLKAIRGLASTTSTTADTTGLLRDQIASQPRITTKFNKAKRILQQALSELERKLRAAHTTTVEVVELIEGSLAK